MSTQEIEKLLIDAAPDFREVLTPMEEEPYEAVCVGTFENYRICIAPDEDHETGWQWQWRNVDRDRCKYRWLPRPIAVAAMTESWRERYRTDYQISISERWSLGHAVPEGDVALPCGWIVFRNTSRDDRRCHMKNGVFADSCYGEDYFPSLPAAIVGVAKALANEKREKAAPKWWEVAAERIVDAAAGFSVRNPKADIAAIIFEELKKANP